MVLQRGICCAIFNRHASSRLIGKVRWMWSSLKNWLNLHILKRNGLGSDKAEERGVALNLVIMREVVSQPFTCDFRR